MPNGVPGPSASPQVILDHARRQCDQQDAVLESHKRQAILIAGAYLSTGTIAIAALTPVISGDNSIDSTLTIRAAVVVLVWSLFTSLIAARVQVLAQNWQGVVSIEGMIDTYHGASGQHLIVELDLAATLESHRTDNETTLFYIKRWLLIQALIAFIGVAVLVVALQSLT
ncbi:MAG: hypothetical protein F4Y12_06600 [Acidimicrobiaceae bacterium]|nr:hypothetical protein [Acidimicrobiaceae bacterium]